MKSSEPRPKRKRKHVVQSDSDSLASASDAEAPAIAAAAVAAFSSSTAREASAVEGGECEVDAEEDERELGRGPRREGREDVENVDERKGKGELLGKEEGIEVGEDEAKGDESEVATQPQHALFSLLSTGGDGHGHENGHAASIVWL